MLMNGLTVLNYRANSMSHSFHSRLHEICPSGRSTQTFQTSRANFAVLLFGALYYSDVHLSILPMSNVKTLSRLLCNSMHTLT